MKKISILLLLFWAFQSNCQDIDVLYFYRHSSATLILDQQTDQGACSGTMFKIGRFGIVKVLSVEGDIVKVELDANNSNTNNNDNFGEIAKRYCIKKADFDNNFGKDITPKKRIDYGILAVPFKLRFDPVQISAGGELGGYYGWYLSKRSRTVFIIHAGMTFIPLNDINSENPQTKVGFTPGIGLINKVNENFQIGLVTGIDLFEGVEDWTYKYQPWLSLEIGYVFTK